MSRWLSSKTRNAKLHNSCTTASCNPSPKEVIESNGNQTRVESSKKWSRRINKETVAKAHVPMQPLPQLRARARLRCCPRCSCCS